MNIWSAQRRLIAGLLEQSPTTVPPSTFRDTTIDALGAKVAKVAKVERWIDERL
jgi:hypothetical protein